MRIDLRQTNAKDEARRIAVNVAKLQVLLFKA
jgi:hypothetical protein